MKRALPFVLFAAAWQPYLRAADIYVSPGGSDRNPGNRASPLASLPAAQKMARKLKSAGQVTVWLRAGTYYLADPLAFTPEDSGTAWHPVIYRSAPGEEAVISGGVRLNLTWTPYRDGIMMARVPAGLHTDQLLVDGKLQILARDPNYDPSAAYFDGWSPDAFSKERAARWKDPRGGFIHAMHRNMWGDFHYVITGKDAEGNITYEGGWQNNRRMGMHDKYRFVENIFEELDAPGEWFLDDKTSTLYFFPPAGLDLKNSKVEAVRLRNLVEFRGTEQAPVRWIRLLGLTFRDATRTFMDTREPLLRSDWTIYRGGAIILTGTEDCTLEECVIDHVGGNAVFVNEYNRRTTVRRCHISEIGANGVAFVGDPNAVRNPLFEYSQRQSINDIDLTPGPKTNNYPAECLLEDSLIHRTGRIEKQTAPVEISMSRGITVRHCSIYDVPRAGINIGDGTWGGHLIEYNDVFDTVKETGDHGSFNSWGRDRYWQLRDLDSNTITAGKYRDLPRLDSVSPTILCNNRWRCDHGWDIDLDDGSSNYQILNNLALNGGIKLREGFYRTVENNVMVNNSFHPHVWFTGSQDVVLHNIVAGPYRPIRVPTPWGAECDFNLLHVPGLTEARPTLGLQKQSGRDAHSIEADARFVDPATGDYRVRPDSPALALGFKNLTSEPYGVLWPPLKRLARTPPLPSQDSAKPATLQSARDPRPSTWLGASVRNVIGMGEVSASGLPGEVGVLVLDVPPSSRASAAGLLKGDVVLRLDGKGVEDLRQLQRLSAESPAFGTVKIGIVRGQKEITLELEAPL
jgi:hypothetical protein